MQVFVSWSRPRSQRIAVATKTWLEKLFQGLKVFVSDKDIEAGSRWQDEIARNLEASNFGIMCVTPENVERPWLLFEAGALAKKFETARAVPYLYEIGATRLTQLGSPLGQLHAMKVDRDGTLGLAKMLQQHLQIGPGANLDELFTMLWSNGWEEALNPEAIGAATEPSPPKPTAEEAIPLVFEQLRAVADMMGKVLEHDTGLIELIQSRLPPRLVLPPQGLASILAGDTLAARGQMNADTTSSSLDSVVSFLNNVKMARDIKDGGITIPTATSAPPDVSKPADTVARRKLRAALKRGPRGTKKR